MEIINAKIHSTGRSSIVTRSVAVSWFSFCNAEGRCLSHVLMHSTSQALYLI